MNIPANLQRRPFLAPIGLLAAAAAAAAAALVVLVGAAWWLQTSTPTTVIVVRHAPQLLGDGGEDPPLSPQGEAQVAALAQALGGSRLAAIYITADLRSRSTVAPLAQRCHVTPQVQSQDDAAGLARQVLSEHAGQTVLIVGHLNTVPAIVSALSGAGNTAPAAPEDYATMYIVTVPRVGRAPVLRLQY